MAKTVKKASTTKKASTKTVAAKTTTKKSTTTKTTAKKARTTKAAATKKTAKSTAKKPVAKKSTTAAKRTTTTKVAAKPAAKKSTTTKTTTTAKKRTTAKKTTTKRTATSKTRTTKSRTGRVNKTTITGDVIDDAVVKKSRVKRSAPGEVAKVSLDRTTIEKAQKPKVESFEPVSQSILDNSASEQSFRYSDEDLAKFKEMILKKLDTQRENLNYFQKLISRKDSSGTEDTDNRFNSIEDSTAAMEREHISEMASRLAKIIDHLEKALIRIENKTYGICRVTGKLIEKGRLKSVPHATLSIEAKKNRK